MQSGRYRFLLEMVIGHFHNANQRLLDVGSHLLHFAMAARIVGYQVFGTDVLYHVDMHQNKRRQERYQIIVKECDLAAQSLPFADDFFDVANFAETLEHLSFNPIPALKEIHRVLKPGGILFLTTPNATRLGKRIRLLRGRNIYTSLEEFCYKVPYGIHYREYTLKEVIMLLELAGYEVSKNRALYFHQGSGLKKWAKHVVMLLAPSLAGNLFFEARK